MIRRLAPDDLSEFRRVRNEALTLEPRAYGQSLAEFEARPDDAIRAWMPLTFGAFLDGRLVGVASLARDEVHEKMRHRVTIVGVFVTPPARGRGLARALLQACIAHARTMEDVTMVDLSVGHTQPGARRLYESLGFVFWGREPRALRVAGEYIDEDHLALMLDA